MDDNQFAQLWDTLSAKKAEAKNRRDIAVSKVREAERVINKILELQTQEQEAKTKLEEIGKQIRLSLI